MDEQDPGPFEIIDAQIERVGYATVITVGDFQSIEIGIDDIG